MTNEDDDNRDCNARLYSAITDAARSEVEKVAHSVIEQLRSVKASGNYDDVLNRHLWDEYCWQLQNESFSPLSEIFSDTIRNYIETEVEALPKYTQVFITAYAYKYSSNHSDAELGVIDVAAMLALVDEKIKEKSDRLYLDLIGYDRRDALQYHTSPGGTVCSALSDADLLWDILGMHADELIGGASEEDILKIGEELLAEYLDLVSADAAECYVVSQFFSDFQKHISTMLLEQDIIPALENLQGEIEDLLDS